MAENPDKNSPNSSGKDGWFNSWLSAAKNKSTEVLEFVKKDLEEFGTAVKNEATSVVSSAGSVMEKTLSLESPDSAVNSVKRSFSTFLGQMNTVLNPSPDDEDTEMLIVENSETHKLNKYQKALYELQKNSETYLCDPEPHLRKQYECWLEILEPDQLSDDRIAKLVNSSEVLKRHYAKLVPDILEHQLFWRRYLFKKALLEDEIARMEIMEKRELKEREQMLADDIKDGENLKWEKDFAADVELTEEEQIALLEQYENEQKKKSPKRSKQGSPSSGGDSKEIAAETIDKKDNSSPEIKGVTTRQPLATNAKPTENKTAEDKPKTTEDKTPKKADVVKKLSKVDSAVSLSCTPSSSTCSTDDDWEKISDVEK